MIEGYLKPFVNIRLTLLDIDRRPLNIEFAFHVFSVVPTVGATLVVAMSG